MSTFFVEKFAETEVFINYFLCFNCFHPFLIEKKLVNIILTHDTRYGPVFYHSTSKWPSNPNNRRSSVFLVKIAQVSLASRAVSFIMKFLNHLNIYLKKRSKLCNEKFRKSRKKLTHIWLKNYKISTKKLIQTNFFVVNYAKELRGLRKKNLQ